MGEPKIGEEQKIENPTQAYEMFAEAFYSRIDEACDQIVSHLKLETPLPDDFPLDWKVTSTSIEFTAVLPVVNEELIQKLDNQTWIKAAKAIEDHYRKKPEWDGVHVPGIQYNPESDPPTLSVHVMFLYTESKDFKLLK